MEPRKFEILGNGTITVYDNRVEVSGDGQSLSTMYLSKIREVSYGKVRGGGESIGYKTMLMFVSGSNRIGLSLTTSHQEATRLYHDVMAEIDKRMEELRLPPIVTETVPYASRPDARLIPGGVGNPTLRSHLQGFDHGKGD
jgi:hypothetical protein